MSSGARQPQQSEPQRTEPQLPGQRRPAPAPGTSDQRQELEATVPSREELGPEYESFLIERFLEQLDRSIEARIEAHLAGRSRPEPAAQPAFTKDMVGGLAATLGIGIPITAIAGGTAGPLGIMVVWISIALIWLAILGYLPRPKG